MLRQSVFTLVDDPNCATVGYTDESQWNNWYTVMLTRDQVCTYFQRDQVNIRYRFEQDVLIVWDTDRPDDLPHLPPWRIMPENYETRQGRLTLYCFEQWSWSEIARTDIDENDRGFNWIAKAGKEQWIKYGDFEIRLETCEDGIIAEIWPGKRETTAPISTATAENLDAIETETIYDHNDDHEEKVTPEEFEQLRHHGWIEDCVEGGQLTEAYTWAEFDEHLKEMRAG